MLIVGTSIDPHIPAVIDCLPAATTVARFDVDRFPRDLALSISQASDSGVRLIVRESDRAFDVSRPSAVWFRRLGAPGLNADLDPEYRKFALGEAEQALEALLQLTEPRRWINAYWATRRAAVKPYQYQVAARVGLRVPDTLVSNDPDYCARWLEPGAHIAKTLHSPVVVAGETHRDSSFAFTSLVDAATIAEIADVALAPCQFQQLVDKQYEVRLTSIGTRHEAVAISPGPGTQSDLDWRSAAYDCRYHQIDIPVEITTSLEELFGELGIQYAASDFVVDHSGTWWFLEANPHGAWLWLEREVPGLNITASIAEHLISSLL